MLTDKPESNPTPAAKVTSLPRADAITPAQVRYIQKLIAETCTETQKVLDYFGIARIEDIVKSEASRVIRSLEQARSRGDERRVA